MPKVNSKSGIALILCVNMLLACGIIALFYQYGIGYQETIARQNLSDITNINRSSANISSAFFQNQKGRLLDIVQYVTSEDMTSNEALSYICDSNSGDTNYELVGADAKGYAAVRAASGFEPVDYTAAGYQSFAKIFTTSEAGSHDKVLCSQEFTDKVTASKSFAFYAHLQLPDENGTLAYYTLLAVTESRAISGLINLDGGYEGMSTVLVNGQGDYVFGSADFKSDNLFKYFYVFNGLSLDEEQDLASAFADGNGDDPYYFKDSKGRDCVFVYAAVPDTAWYSVSCVPLSSYHDDPRNLRYTLWIAILLVVMMGFNIAWLLSSNRRLKSSVLREQEASSAKTDFLSRMSHDIRTPLNVIIGSALLANEEENPPKTRQYLDNIDHSGKFLLSLVNDILDLNKVESGKMELYPVPYSFSQFKATMASTIGPLCEQKGIEFDITGEDTDETFLLDPVRVNQVFFNILSNSVKFTEPGGHIGLACSHRQQGQDVMLEITASDDGQGMSEEFQERMFDSFSQEHENESSKTQGTGLGLAIVKSLVDLMGGTIKVESALGKGTVFHIAIPVKPAPDQHEEDAKALPDQASLSGKRILLFEDNDINAQIAEALLEHRELVVDRAKDGRQGLEIFSSSEPHYYDALLMDLRMPVMDGFEATRAIRMLPRDDAATVPIIAMTANAYDEDVRKCLDAGMNAHLSKPIDPDALFAMLAQEIG